MYYLALTRNFKGEPLAEVMGGGWGERGGGGGSGGGGGGDVRKIFIQGKII